jgi:hypothetical protein
LSSDDIGVLIAFSPATFDVVLGGNTIVTASRILAEINLDAISFGGHSARFRCGRIYLGNKNPL